VPFVRDTYSIKVEIQNQVSCLFANLDTSHGSPPVCDRNSRQIMRTACHTLFDLFPNVENLPS